MEKIKFLIVCFTICAFVAQSYEKFVRHKFSLGWVKGKTMLSRNYKTFYAFLGLPYAEPPIGDLRFQNPVPYTEPWEYEYDATKEAEPCVQGGAGGVDHKGQEDCLYLNVYIPKLPNDTTTKLPVWFFLYPGRHIFGDANTIHYGPHYIMDQPVIFISAAYRLGPFGFLSTEDDVIPGNFGLKDQAAVLLWIKRYIAEFGGDPNNVAISGESSSSQDVAMHMISPLSKDLFHRGISQSGHCLNYRAILPPGGARAQAWKFARILGCRHRYIKTSEDLLECLKSFPPEYVSGSMYYLMHDYIMPHTYFGIVLEKPEWEGAFLTSHPIYEIEKPNNKSWLLGINTEEGQQKALGIFAFPTKDLKLKARVLTHFDKNAKTLIPNLLGFDYADDPEWILKQIVDRYYKDTPFNQSFLGFSKAFGLSSIQTGMFEITLKYPGTRYFYHYDYLNTPPYQKMYIVRFKFETKEKLGVIHGEELRSLLYQPITFPPTLEGNDRIISEKVVEFWCNFVAYGNPNGKKNEHLWKPVSTDNLEYLYINLTLEMRSRPMWEDYDFFKKLGMPQLMTPERAQKAGFSKRRR